MLKVSFYIYRMMNIIDQHTGSIRIAHITDCHVSNNKSVIASMQKVFKSLQEATPRPELIINTGDSILDANFKTKKKVEEQWKVWKEITSGCDIPVYSVLGNHDILISPAFKFLSAIYQPYNDKALAMQALNITNLFYTFRIKGWKFIALNSIAKRYALDDVQLSWLENELASTQDNICLFSHVPILSIASFVYHLQKNRSSAFPRKEMHSDYFKLQELFDKYKNVRLCLSGHVHYTDDVEYNGVRHICGGAVCGNWWKELTAPFPPEYTMIDLHADGRIEKEIIYY